MNSPIIFSDDVYANIELHVPRGAKQAYAEAEGWRQFKTIIDDIEVKDGKSISHSEVAIDVDEVFQLGVYGTDKAVTWSSSNPSVAYANQCGLIVSMGIAGTTVITAEVDGVKLTCNVTVAAASAQATAQSRDGQGNVVPKIEPTSIKVESVSGNPPVMNVRLAPVGASTTIDWASSDESLATIAHGIITRQGDNDGPVDFSATTANGLEQSITLPSVVVLGINNSTADPIEALHNNVYDINGRCVIVNATDEQLRNLPKGIYIVKGKKFVVR